MKIFSPHRRKMEAKRRYGSKEFQNKVKQAQSYKRIFDPRGKGVFANILHFLNLDKKPYQVAVIFILGVFAYFLFISDYFLVSNIAVAGNAQVSESRIQEVLSEKSKGRWLLIPKNHLLIFSRSSAGQMIATDVPLVKEIKKYKRIWPNKIEIEVVERHPGFALSASGKNYFVDDEGFVVGELVDATGFVNVIDQVTEEVSVGEQLNNIKLVGFLISGIKQWPNKVNTPIKEIKIPGKAALIAQFVSAEGWAVFFDINRPVESQLSNLSIILGRHIPAQNRLKLEYIDLRIEKWAYYCYKNTPCAAQPQATPEENKIEVQ